MKIGIDVREFKKDTYTGIRSILGNVMGRSAKMGGNEFVYFCDRDTDLPALPEEGKKVVIAGDNTFFWDQSRLPLALSREKVDLFFSPYIKTPLWRVCPYVSTICDVIPLEVPKRKGLGALLEKAYFYAYSFLCGRRAVKVITLSENSRERISDTFGIGKEKIEVVYPSVEARAGQAEPDDKAKELIDRYSLERPFLLYVGNFKPHKNLRNLIAAYDLLPGGVQDRYRLMLVGGSEKEMEGIEAVIKEHGLSGKVTPVVNIGHDDVRVFYRHASAFVFPSLAEGFGIPPVEAMAYGVPVASSRLAPMTEVLGEAALFFDPRDPGDISAKVSRLLTEEGLRKEYAARGRERALLFDPDRISRKMMDVLENAGLEKTLCVSSEFPPVRGGISTFLFNLWNRLPKRDIVILTARPAGEDIYPDEGMDIVREAYPLGKGIFSRAVRSILLVWHVLRQCRARNIRRVHCAQVLSAGSAGLLLKWLKGTPYVVYAYSADILEFSRGFFTDWMMRKIFAGSERVIASSIFAKSLIVGHKLAGEDKISVIAPGVDTAEYDPGKGAGRIRETYGIPAESKMLLTVARLAVRKGHDKVIEALPAVVEAYPDVVYVIVGEGGTGPGLAERVREKGLEKNVIFTGEVSAEQLVFFYNACDIFILTPRYIKEEGDVEGFGIVFIEAGACGKPVIAGRSGGVSEAVVDGVTGILVDPENTDRIRDAMLTLLGDASLARKMGTNGLTRAREEFGWKNRARELEKYI